jgi:hypothetical protein
MDSFLLNAPDTPDELEELVPETTWKTVIETNLEMPFNKLKQMPNDILKSSGIQDELLKLDENSVSIYKIEMENGVEFIIIYRLHTYIYIYIVFKKETHIHCYILATHKVQIWRFTN